MEVAPFLSIFTIFCRFSPFFIDFHDLRTFVAIYILSRFTHFFRNFFWAKIAFSATSHVFCMYDSTSDIELKCWSKICWNIRDQACILSSWIGRVAPSLGGREVILKIMLWRIIHIAWIAIFCFLVEVDPMLDVHPCYTFTCMLSKFSSKRLHAR